VRCVIASSQVNPEAKYLTTKNTKIIKSKGGCERSHHDSISRN